MVQCPDCGCQFYDSGGVMHSTTTRKQRRRWRRKPMYTPYYQQVQALGPGEALWRPIESDPDVMAPLRYAAVGAGLVTGVACSIVGGVHWQSWAAAIPCTFFGCASALYFVVTRRVLTLDDAHFKVKLRESTEQPQEPDTRPIPLSPRKKRNSPTSHSTRLPQIPTPAAGRLHLVHWFRRVVMRNGVGFSQGIAERYHIARKECKTIQNVFVGEGWATRKSRKGGLAKVELNEDGLDAMREVIEAHYPPPMK